MFLGQNNALKNIDKIIKVASESTEEALIEVGERGVGNLKRGTPVKTGILRNSMSYTIDKKVYKPLGSTDNVNPSKDKDSVYIGTNVIYAPSVEFRSTNGSEGFFLRAYIQTKKQAKEIFKEVYKGVAR